LATYNIQGALTVQVLLDYLMIWDKLESVSLTDSPDQTLWRWTKDGSFTTASAYRLFFSGQHGIPGAKLLHKTRAPSKYKFFIWLVLHDRVWTAARRRKHRLQDDDRCAFCDQEPETITHLLIGFSYSRDSGSFCSRNGVPWIVGRLASSYVLPTGGKMLRGGCTKVEEEETIRQSFSYVG
jgi:hypothetical protein